MNMSQLIIGTASASSLPRARSMHQGLYWLLQRDRCVSGLASWPLTRVRLDRRLHQARSLIGASAL